MKITVVFALMLAAFCAAPALAYHPLITEDTTFVGLDKRQLVAAAEYQRERGDYSTRTLARLYYGLFNKLDIIITVPWEGWNANGISESGLGDVLVETKFEAAGKAGWVLALKPGFSMPAGNEAKSLGAGKGGVWCYGLAGRGGAAWQFYLSAGFLLNRNSRDERENIVKVSGAAAYTFVPGLLVTAELAGSSNFDKRSASHPVTSGLGLVWSPYPTLDLDAGVQFGLTRPAPDLGLLGGITLRL